MRYLPLLLIIISTTAYAGDPDLVGHWKLDETVAGTFVDSSLYGNDGTGAGAGGANNTPQPSTTIAPVPTGSIRSLDFDGTDDEVTISGTDYQFTTGNMTVSLWARFDTLPAFGVMVSTYSAPNGWQIVQRGSTDFYLYVNNGIAVSSTVAPTTGAWTHIVGVYVRNGNSTIYVNGVDVSTAQVARTAGAHSNNLVLGATAASANFVDGKLDDVRIYNRALNAAEVKALYQTTGPNDETLVGHWKFDETTAGTFADSSIYGNTGTGAGAGGANNTPQPSTTVAPVPLGSARSLDFDGTDDQVDVGNISAMNNASKLTVSMWGKRSAVDATVGVGKYDSNSSRISINAFSSGGLVYLQLANGENSYGSFTSNDTDWHHWVLVFDGTQSGNAGRLKGYMDGVAQSLTFGGTIPSSTANISDSFRIGFENPRYTSGKIDDVRVYNRALNPAEIKQLYQTTRPTDPGLVAHYTFEENAADTCSGGEDVCDQSGNGLHGTWNGSGGGANTTPTWTSSVTAPSSIYAMDFDGTDDYVQVAHSSTLTPRKITMSAWFRTENKNANQRVISKTETGAYQISLNENSACGTAKLCALINVGGTYYGASINISSISNDTWYHIVGTYDGETLNMYLDSVLQNTNTSPSGDIKYLNNTPLCIGQESSIAGNCTGDGSIYFNGLIDDVRIYNYALNAEQVKDLYEAGELRMKLRNATIRNIQGV